MTMHRLLTLALLLVCLNAGIPAMAGESGSNSVSATEEESDSDEATAEEGEEAAVSDSKSYPSIQARTAVQPRQVVKPRVPTSGRK